MRAISSFSFEAGISTRECLAAMALRIRVNISAIGSVMLYSKIRCRVSGAGWFLLIPGTPATRHPASSPARLHDAGNLSLQRQLAKTDATQIELAQVAARAATPLATSVLAHAKLRSPRLFRNQ